MSSIEVTAGRTVSVNPHEIAEMDYYPDTVYSIRINDKECELKIKQGGLAFYLPGYADPMYSLRFIDYERVKSLYTVETIR